MDRPWAKIFVIAFFAFIMCESFLQNLRHFKSLATSANTEEEAEAHAMLIFPRPLIRLSGWTALSAGIGRATDMGTCKTAGETPGKFQLWYLAGPGEMDWVSLGLWISTYSDAIELALRVMRRRQAHVEMHWVADDGTHYMAMNCCEWGACESELWAIEGWRIAMWKAMKVLEKEKRNI